MSAFLVDADVVNVLAVALARGVMVGRFKVEPGGRYIVDPPWALEGEAAGVVAKELRAMNLRALEARYGSRGVPPFRFLEPARGYTPVYVLRQLGCFLYQCAEGDVPRSELFRDVQAFHDRLGAAIVEGSPEYNELNCWGHL